MKTTEQKRTIRKFKTEIKKFINKGISSGGICLKFEEKNINRALKDFFQKIILENPKNPLSFIEKYSLYVKSGDTFKKWWYIYWLVWYVSRFERIKKTDKFKISWRSEI